MSTATASTPASPEVSHEQRVTARRAVVASSIGNALEWFDIIVYSSLAVVISTLFFGGPNGPTSLFGWDFPGPDWMWGILWLGLKVIAFLFVFVWMRATLPRLRYDQLMDLGWKLLIPLSLGWLLLLAAVRIGDDQDWNIFLVVAISLAAIIAVAGLLAAAIRVGKSNRELTEAFE